ncbi:MAG: hypothetical protein NC388_01275 [Clostridium sp.]|nr:hypothetical protein [Clostridium sp.]
MKKMLMFGLAAAAVYVVYACRKGREARHRGALERAGHEADKAVERTAEAGRKGIQMVRDSVDEQVKRANEAYERLAKRLHTAG